MAAVVIAATVVWLFVRDGDERPAARAVSLADLQALERSLGRPVFWAGPRRGTVYELTQTDSGRVFVRYLPADVEVGSEDAEFLSVGTYPQADALAGIVAAQERDGAVDVAVPGGGIGVYNEGNPTSVHFTYPDAAYQVEAFEPRAGVALELVTSGQVRSVSAPAPAGPRAVSLDELRAFAADTPVYWAGPRAGVTYELTETPSGGAFVRYLDQGADVGDPRRDFLAIGTYPDTDAFANVRAEGRRNGYETISLPGGGIAAYDASRPTNVYVAYRGRDQQVEVFSPDEGEALRLVTSGRVEPVD